MKYLVIAASILLNSGAFAADAPARAVGEIGKSTQTALFRVKVAQCKDQAKATGIKASSVEFYSYMAGCIDKVTVTVASK